MAKITDKGVARAHGRYWGKSFALARAAAEKALPTEFWGQPTESEAVHWLKSNCRWADAVDWNAFWESYRQGQRTVNARLSEAALNGPKDE